MLPFGHVGFSFSVALLLEGLVKKRRIRRSSVESTKGMEGESHQGLIHHRLFLITLFLPDLFDKIISQLLVQSGRAYGHTILFVLVATVIAFVLTRKNKQVGLTVFLGAIVHLILDLDNGGFVPFFWPIFPQTFISSKPWSLQRLLIIYMTAPPISEVMGMLLIFVILIVKRREISSYLHDENILLKRIVGKLASVRDVDEC